MDDQRQKRRSVEAIAHLFLSCQDENNETTECNHHVAPTDSTRLSYGIRIGAADPSSCETSPALFRPQQGELSSIEPGGLAAGPIGHPTEQCGGLESRGSVQLVIDPYVYPVARLVWAEATAQDEIFQAAIPLRREVWLNVANYCKRQAEHFEALGQDKLANTWNRVADFILGEIAADEKRHRNRELYGSFADFVATINARTDIDKARKAQMIHDKACQLKVD
jgi:hypothetical protein